MSVTTYWAPNQAALAQVETYTFSAPSGVGNTYTATINGKSVTYTSISGDTAASAASAMYALLNVSTSIAPELTEITFANPSSGVLTATAKVPGTPFANVPGTALGLVFSTGNGLANGITTAHTTANASPSDVNDAQNWLRVNLAVNPPTKTRALPQAGDDVVVAGTTVPLLWNLDQLAAVRFNTFTRYQSFEGTIGLPDYNPTGYTEWRATSFAFSGPSGSVPAGGLTMTLGYNDGAGQGPGRERYDLGSQQVTLTALAGGQAIDTWAITFKGIHTQNAITALNGTSIGIATSVGAVANVATVKATNAAVGIGAGVTWTGASSLTAYGSTLVLNAAPAALSLNNGTAATFATDGLTWASITAQNGCNLTWLAGGIITSLTMSISCTLDKSADARGLTVTNATIDGDTCAFLDPLNAITWTNAVSVKQQVAQGPFQFTGTRTVKVI